ncbi:MAG TPA: AmmeMemoRadiSam system protein A [Steroidobacteraceae bacterium]|nr:AmmeMemoRadiSam system protein A [Steroidobacteraceae bacterium]
MLDEAARCTLLALARESLRAAMDSGALGFLPARDYADALRAWRSSFVTLSRAGKLRGCCGRLEADRPLVEDVWDNAYSSGFRDPRFEPLLAHELQDLQIEISVLSPLEKLDVHGTDELLAVLVAQRDGLLLEHAGERVTFIPHVWEGVADPATFVRLLREKAGWPADGWESDLQAWRFEAESF